MNDDYLCKIPVIQAISVKRGRKKWTLAIEGGELHSKTWKTHQQTVQVIIETYWNSLIPEGEREKCNNIYCQYIFSSISHFPKVVWTLWEPRLMSDVLCSVSCLCWAARRTGREIMIHECCCASHSVSRTRAHLTSCLTGHAIPGSGTAAISKFLSACFLLSQQNCMCLFSWDYIFGLCFLALSQFTFVWCTTDELNLIFWNLTDQMKKAKYINYNHVSL